MAMAELVGFFVMVTVGVGVASGERERRIKLLFLDSGYYFFCYGNLFIVKTHLYLTVHPLYTKSMELIIYKDLTRSRGF